MGSWLLDRTHSTTGLIMTKVTITLSEEEKDFVEGRLKVHGLESPGAYFNLLLLRERLRPQRGKIKALLLEAINEGEFTEVTARDWDEIEREAVEVLAKEKQHARQGRSKRSSPS
jgi:hypothetical protein